MALWPERPIVPLAWDDEETYHPIVSSTLAEGFCPKHGVMLRTADGHCGRCGLDWELVSSAGTIPVTGPYPHFAQTDGKSVIVTRSL